MRDPLSRLRLPLQFKSMQGVPGDALAGVALFILCS